jgi:phosphate transport system permease protein
MGETAPLLFTTAGAFALTANLGAQMNALPIQIYNDIQSPRQAIIDRAWGAGLTLVALVLILNVVARIVSRRSRMA